MSMMALGGRAALILCVALAAGCAELWPFGGRTSAQVDRTAGAPAGLMMGRQAAMDATIRLPGARLLVAERGRQGVILRADGIAPWQGFHSPELRPAGRSADGLETVELRAVAPPVAGGVGPERTRLLSVGRFYSNRDMAEIRAFRIIMAERAVDVPVP